MSFLSVFIAIVLGFALIVAAFMINRQRPRVETDQPNAALVKATHTKTLYCRHSVAAPPRRKQILVKSEKYVSSQLTCINPAWGGHGVPPLQVIRKYGAPEEFMRNVGACH